MAKKSNNYGIAPWEMTKGAITNFVAVTDFNRGNAIVMGRIFYYIELSGSKYIYRGATIVRPRLTKGKWLWPHYPWAIVPRDVQNKTHWEVYYDKEEDYNDYKNDFNEIITNGINKKLLYICPKDPILTFFKK